jgi:hypothetical protein
MIKKMILNPKNSRKGSKTMLSDKESASRPTFFLKTMLVTFTAHGSSSRLKYLYRYKPA